MREIQHHSAKYIQLFGDTFLHLLIVIQKIKILLIDILTRISNKVYEKKIYVSKYNMISSLLNVIFPKDFSVYERNINTRKIYSCIFGNMLVLIC